MSSQANFIHQSETLEVRKGTRDRDLSRYDFFDAARKAKEELGAFQVNTAAAAYIAKLKVPLNEV